MTLLGGGNLQGLRQVTTPVALASGVSEELILTRRLGRDGDLFYVWDVHTSYSSPPSSSISSLRQRWGQEVVGGGGVINQSQTHTSHQRKFSDRKLA